MACSLPTELQERPPVGRSNNFAARTSRLSSACTRARLSAARFSDAASIAESFLEDVPVPPSSDCPPAAACARSAAFCCVSFATMSSCISCPTHARSTDISEGFLGTTSGIKRAVCSDKWANRMAIQTETKEICEARCVQNDESRYRISAAMLILTLEQQHPVQTRMHAAAPSSKYGHCCERVASATRGRHR